MALIKLKNLGEIKYISLDRPSVLNAFNLDMMQEFLSYLHEIDQDQDTKVLIIKGEGRAFSAGVDLKAAGEKDFESDSLLMKTGLEICEKIAQFSKISIAQVHGYCFTGALEILLAFDMAFAATDTKFGDTHAKFGIIPRWGMTQHLARRVGLSKAKEISFRSHHFDALEAEKLGIINKVYPIDEIDAEVLNIAQEICSNNFDAIQQIKKLYDTGYATTYEKGLQLEKDYKGNAKPSHKTIL